MRKTVLGVGIILLVISAAAMAANQYGIADKRQVTFYSTVRVGDTLLPAGDYEVVHQMQGDEHIMVFTKTGGGKKAEARVKCTLTPLSAPAVKTEVEYKVTSAKEQVLTRMVFRGDRAEHRF
jgi:hypothetical protein